MPETKVSKKLVLSFIASKGSTFDTVGFVKGKPGGLGMEGFSISSDLLFSYTDYPQLITILFNNYMPI